MIKHFFFRLCVGKKERKIGFNQSLLSKIFFFFWGISLWGIVIYIFFFKQKNKKRKTDVQQVFIASEKKNIRAMA